MFGLGITVRQCDFKQLLLVLQYSITIRYEIIFSAAIDSTDNCRKDKSLGVLSQKFLIMFLLSKVKYPPSYALFSNYLCSEEDTSSIISCEGLEVPGI